SDNVAVTGYRIYRSGTFLIAVAATARSYSDTTVSDNTDYTYTLSAIDAAGNESAKAATSPATVHTPTNADTSAPTAPSNLRTTAVAVHSAVIAWNASTDNRGVVGYHVYRDDIYVGDSTGLTYTDANLDEETEYVYVVK